MTTTEKDVTLTTDSGLAVISARNGNGLAVTLDEARSAVWAGQETPDARELDSIRREVRREVRALMAEHGAKYAEIFGADEDGGCIVDVIEVD